MKDFKLPFWQQPFVFFMIPMVIALIVQLIFYIKFPLIVVTIFIFLTAFKIAELMTMNFQKYIDRKLHEYINKHKTQ